jgi:hypothetical protein
MGYVAVPATAQVCAHGLGGQRLHWVPRDNQAIRTRILIVALQPGSSHPAPLIAKLTIRWHHAG